MLDFVRQTAASSVGKGKDKDVDSWHVVSEFISDVMHEANTFLPLAMETENVVKSESLKRCLETVKVTAADYASFHFSVLSLFTFRFIIIHSHWEQPLDPAH